MRIFLIIAFTICAAEVIAQNNIDSEDSSFDEESFFSDERDDKIQLVISDLANERIDEMIANSLCINSKYYTLHPDVYKQDSLLLSLNRNKDGSYTFLLDDFYNDFDYSCKQTIENLKSLKGTMNGYNELDYSSSSLGGRFYNSKMNFATISLYKDSTSYSFNVDYMIDQDKPRIVRFEEVGLTQY